MARERKAGGKKSFMDNYVKVNDRIALFRGEFPEGFIHTQSKEVGEDVVEFKALVFRNKEEVEAFSNSSNGNSIAAATGHSRTYVSESDPEKCLEKGETVAVGRALAMLGFEVTKSIASEEEVEVFNKRTAKEENKEETKEETKEEVSETVEETTTTSNRRSRRNKDTAKEETTESNIEDIPEDKEEETTTSKPRRSRVNKKENSEKTEAVSSSKRKLKRRR